MVGPKRKLLLTYMLYVDYVFAFSND